MPVIHPLPYAPSRPRSTSMLKAWAWTLAGGLAAGTAASACIVFGLGQYNCYIGRDGTFYLSPLIYAPVSSLAFLIWWFVIRTEIRTTTVSPERFQQSAFI